MKQRYDHLQRYYRTFRGGRVDKHRPSELTQEELQDIEQELNDKMQDTKARLERLRSQRSALEAELNTSLFANETELRLEYEKLEAHHRDLVRFQKRPQLPPKPTY